MAKVFEEGTKSKAKVHLIILDGLGVGAMPDAYMYNDLNTNTLKSISKSVNFSIPNLTKMGILKIPFISIPSENNKANGAYGKAAERSKGKDTTTGHWEIAGVISDTPFPTYPSGFPKEIIDLFEKLTGRNVLCNLPFSGTAVIEEYGLLHMQTGDLIVYTSADSVFQIAAHEDVIPVEQLYKYCEIARKILVGTHAVARVIARPFIGIPGNFSRTAKRKDFSLKPPSQTLLDLLKESGYEVVGIGKIEDIFAGQGLTQAVHTISNKDGMQKAIEYLDKDFSGLVFTNLVDFDMLYGHRNDVEGYAKALSEFDKWLESFLLRMGKEDILIITADHGCDPASPSTDHSREYVPILIHGEKIKRDFSLGVLPSFSYIGATIADIFKIKYTLAGESLLPEIKRI